MKYPLVPLVTDVTFPLLFLWFCLPFVMLLIVIMIWLQLLLNEVEMLSAEEIKKQSSDDPDSDSKFEDELTEEESQNDASSTEMYEEMQSSGSVETLRPKPAYLSSNPKGRKKNLLAVIANSWSQSQKIRYSHAEKSDFCNIVTFHKKSYYFEAVAKMLQSKLKTFEWDPHFKEVDELSTRNCPCKMSRLPPKSPLASPVSEGKNSRVESLDNLSMDSFWLEVENIKQSAEAEQEECSLADVKTQEEGEAEAEWLQDAGLSDLLGDRASENDNIVLLSTLTKTQAAAVQRRLDTYSRSRRRKNKHPVRDVRDIFGVVSSEETAAEKEKSSPDQLWHNLRTSNVQKSETQDYSCTVRNPGKEEVFNMDVAYSEQAAVLLKGSLLSESRRLKDGNALTKFKILKGRLGVTRVGDLSAQDMKKIPTLALIELTALCDILGFELKRNKAAKLKTTEKRLFGVPLNALLENDQKLLPNTKVPLLLQALLSCLEKKGLETEGILRVSGSQTRIKSLEQKLERDFYTGLFHWDEVHQNDVSGLLKRFIRELPAPLLTAEYLPAFAAVQNIPDLKQRLQALNLLILILPEPNRNTLKALLEFLSKVVARENNNKMNLWNVSTVMAPNLFMHKGLPNKIPEGKEKQLAEGAADVVRMMIHYQDLLWTVSSFLVAQVRKLNESNSKRYQFCDKRIKNLLRKIHADKDKVEKNQAEPSKTVKVHASLLLKDSLEVHLNNATRVADVLRQFQKNLCQNGWNIVNTVNLLKCNNSMDCTNLLLYEVGGNIGERCLDPDTYLLDLYHVNPHAEWIIKQNPSYPRMF